ncbi:MAG: glycosyltransferase family 4 protein [Burkholderiales bacterium]|nr:glycosyltransferase family 4 protein [Burkholderiales bacterium]
MKIGIDGRALQGFRTGVGRYVYELCRELDRMLPTAQFFVYSSMPLEMPVLSERWVLRLDESPFAKYMKPVLWLKYRCGLLCKKDNLDVFWGGATFLPRLPCKVRTVITVYDLNFKIVPQTMSITHRWAFRLFFKKDVMRADVVTTISKGSSKRLFDLFGRAVDTIVYPAIDASFSPQSETVIREVLSRHGLSPPYLLAVATWEPRKNLELLLHTFLDMKKQGLLGEYKLVLVGGRGWKDQRLAATLSGTDSVIPLGYIPDEHLAPLYSGAELFIFPSFYEGFGMPVAEASACGTTVVTSDTPELREAGEGGNVIYVAPTQEGIRQGILAGLSPGEMPDALIKDSYPSWETSAHKLAATLVGKSTTCLHRERK